MIRFAVSYDNEAIVSTLSRQLSWLHFLDLIYIDDPLKQGFYTEMCRLEERGIRVAEYLTELPPREVLEQKLKSAVAIARERLAGRKTG